MPSLTFIRPLVPCSAVRPPKGDGWLHEPKWDGFRFEVIKDGSKVRLYSRHGAEYTDRLPGMVEAFAKLPTSAAILDGELSLIDTAQSARPFPLVGFHRPSPQA
jgi:bifunctional non-homologous end joining protein LigD